MANIRHSLDVLLPWQRPMPKKQKLKNKRNYIANLSGKSHEQRLQDNGTRVSFVTLASSCGHFCRNRLGSHLKFPLKLSSRRVPDLETIRWARCSTRLWTLQMPKDVRRSAENKCSRTRVEKCRLVLQGFTNITSITSCTQKFIY